MKSFLKGKFNTLYFFYQYLGFRMFILLGFSFLMVLLDSIGLTMFIPLLQIADGTEISGTSDNTSKIIGIVKSFFTFFHLNTNIVTMLLSIVLLFILKGFFYYYATKYLGINQQIFSRKIRTLLSVGVRDLMYKEFVRTDIGKMQNSLTGESWQVVYACSQYMESIRNGMFLLIYLSFAFLMDWRFSILVTIGGYLSNTTYKYFYRRTEELSRDITKNNHKYGAIVIEVVNHYKYLKSTGRSMFFINRLNDELGRLTGNNIEVAKLNAQLSALREPMMMIVISIVIAVHVLVFRSSLSSVMIILILFYRAMQTIINLQVNWNNYLTNKGSIENVMDFQKYLDEHKEVFSGTAMLPVIDSIRLENLSLYYGDFEALSDVNLEIHRNQSVAFVGESGSGKTSLVNVLCTLMPFDKGSFLVNGQSIKTYNNIDFKSKVGYIAQEPSIFNADIFDNVTFWNERTADNLRKFHRIMQMCSLQKFLDGLPEKENTLLGNNGVNISGGQKQRISIARELYRDIEILIMDEATSALDSETEREIKESIESLHGKITIVSIAHRLSTIHHADNIFLLEKGKIAAQGSFEELKVNSAYFKKLTELQGI
ncbi:ABC transporter ATP-binding protein [Pedobacter sp. AW31-3R]|uniref:ABC transporter ATP-binding protein n=1 Tax=Pedobacter sp. AW31-3R TaxID=3445781 RepID=UPI003FA10C50